MSPQKQTQFSSPLPYELILHIFAFAVDKETGTTRECMKLVSKFQFLSSKLNSMKEMQNYFNEYWWTVFERRFSMNPYFKKDLEEMKLEMIEKGELKRKVLLMYHIKYNLMNSSNSSKPREDRREEFKLVMLGEGGVGKSSLTIQFIQGVFLTYYDPTFDDSYRKQVLVDDNLVLFEILDSAGPEEYSLDHYIRNGEGFLMVCDNFLGDLAVLCEKIIRIKDTTDVPIVFALNKVDLLENDPRKDQIIEDTTGEINSIIKNLQLPNTSIMRTSAKTAENVTNLFEECYRRKKYGNLKDVELLRNVIKKDSQILEEFPTRNKCSIM